MMPHVCRRSATLLACLGMFVLVAGCSGQQLASSVQDESLTPGPTPEPEFTEAAVFAPEPIPEPDPTIDDLTMPQPEPEMAMESMPEPMMMEEPFGAEPDMAMEPFGAEPEMAMEPCGAEPEMAMELEPEPLMEEPFGAEPEMAMEPEPFEEASLSIEPEPFEMSLEPVAVPLVLDDVYFDFDRSSLRGDARDALEFNAQHLREAANWTLTIEGHCDERGTGAYNLVLGERRAEAVKRYLEDLGLSGFSIDVVSYGKERPSCFDPSDECWQQNRRAHFVFTE